jgi:competence protein CoiA
LEPIQVASELVSNYCQQIAGLIQNCEGDHEMLSACNRFGEVQAAEVEVEDGPFYCPACQGSVILKQGRIKIPHFAHLTGTECVHSNEGESEEHRLAKLEIYAALRRTPGVTDVRLERYLQEVRPDISFVLNGELVAIEIQFSHLSGDQIAWRTKAYARKHIAVLWTPTFPMELFRGRYAPKDWERYLHTLYYGRVYYWLEEVKLVPVKFEEYLLPPNWYSGERRSRRYVSPRMLPTVSIPQLAPVWRKPWRDLPRARLWCEAWEDR